MARKSPKQFSKKPKQRLPATSQAPAPLETATSGGRIWRVCSRLVDSAIDSALENMWPIVGGLLWSAAMTVLIAAYLFFRNPEPWLYVWLKYAAVWMSGVLFPLVVLLGLALLGLRRRRHQEELKSAEYYSHEKGALDYRAELKPTIKRYAGVLREIRDELNGIGRCSTGLAHRINLVAWSPALTRWMASRGAKALNKHSKAMDRIVADLEKRSQEFLEVSYGCIKYAPPASEGNKSQLLGLKESLDDLDQSSEAVITSLQTVVSSARNVYEQSQDLNTSVNWLTAVTEQNIRAVKNFQSEMGRKLFPLLEKKLTS